MKKLSDRLKKFIKKLLVFYALGYTWGKLKAKILKKGKNKGRKEVEIN